MSGGLPGVKAPWWTLGGSSGFRQRGALPLQGPSPYRDGNGSVLVHIRLRFLLQPLQTLRPGLEEELLQRGLHRRLQGHGLPLATYGTIASVWLTGK